MSYGSYDHWKTTEPDDPYDPQRDAEWGEREDEMRCDSCGRVTEDPIWENRCPRCGEMFRHPEDCEGCIEERTTR